MAIASVIAVAVVLALALGGAAVHAAFPGQNGRIACEGLRGPPIPAGASRSEIFSVNPDGSAETVLTNNIVRDGDPAYSPDGTKIAFESQRDSLPGVTNSEIYVANNDGDLEGPDVKRLTFNSGTTVIPGNVGVIAGTGGTSGTDRAPSWSPDGTEIVFHSGRLATFTEGGTTTQANDFEIYKMSATTPETVAPAQRLTSSRGQDAIPSWSPDGTKIAFQSLREANATLSQNLEVFTMNPDGGAVRNVSNNPGSPNNPATSANENSNGLDRDVTWSPDSAQLAFSSTRSENVAGNQNFEVWRMNRDGSNPVRLTSNPSTPGEDNDYDAPHSWSPDGQRILFTSGRTSTPTESVFMANTMSAMLGESAGLQPVAETNIFVRCDWARPPAATPAATPPGAVTSPGQSGPGVPAPSSALLLSRASLSPRAFRAAGVRTPRGRRRPRPVGTRVRFTLSRAASVRMTLALRTGGRRVSVRVGRRVVTRCVAPTRSRQRRTRCTRFRYRGFVALNGRAGANSMAFTGRLRGRSLRPGAYRATLVATDAAGRRSNAVTLSFTVVRR